MEPFDLRKWKGFRKAGGNVKEPAVVTQVIIDSLRVYTPQALFVALKGEHRDGHQYLFHAANRGAKFALIDQKCPTSQIPKGLITLKVEDPLKAFQEIAGAYRREFPCQIVGITGSYGKTMVKDLIFAFLNETKNTLASPESFNSQIGVPLSLLNIQKNHSLAIIEVGVSKVGEMARLKSIIQANHAILTKVGSKHLQNFGFFDIAWKEMLSFIDPATNSWSLSPWNKQLIDVKSHFFWDKMNKKLPHASWISKKKQEIGNYCVHFPKDTLFTGHLKACHDDFLNLINIAIKAAWLLGCSANEIKRILENYTPQPMSQEFIHTCFSERIIIEPYAEDPQSVVRALKQFDKPSSEGKNIFIFEGLRSSKNLFLEKDYGRIAEAISETKMDRLVLVGDHPYDLLIKKVKAFCPKTDLQWFADCEKACKHVQKQLKPKDTVLIQGGSKKTLDTVACYFQGSISQNRCVINLAAIATNVKVLQKIVGKDTRIMPMVKAQGYGTENGVVKFLESQGIDIFGVSYVDEGVALKKCGIKSTIFVMHAAHGEIMKAVFWGFELGVSDKCFIEALNHEAARQNTMINVHLLVDTGMRRLGCRVKEALELARLISKSPFLKLKGIMTHFTSSENPMEDSFSKHQIQCFDQVIKEIEKEGIDVPWRHASNSSAIARFSLPQYNMVRPGIALYGLAASAHAKKEMDLRAAISLQSRIVGIHVCKKGETVSYGRSYKILKETGRIATIPIGYFDGLHRHFSGKGYVLIHGKKAPMVGQICMDFHMVDITEIDEAEVGDPVLLFGEDERGNTLAPEDLANNGGSIVHELITCLGPRIQRIFIHDENARSC